MTSKISKDDLGRTALVLVHWNTKVFLDKCFESLQKQTYQDFDIYFIDNGSEDDGFDYVKRTWTKKFPNRITYFDTGKNLGFAAGHNVGINMAVEKGDYDNIAVLNLDTKVAPDWLENLLTRLNSDEKIGLATSKLLLFEKFRIFEITAKKDTQLSKPELDSTYRKILYRKEDNGLISLIRMDFNKFSKKDSENIYFHGQIFNDKIKMKEGESVLVGVPFQNPEAKLSLDHEGDFKIKEILRATNIIQNYGSEFDSRILTYRDKYFLVPESEIVEDTYSEAACGCALAIKTKLIKEIGAFDERLVSYFEDSEISERYKNKGYLIAMANDAHVYHYFWGGTSFRKDEKSKRDGYTFREYYWKRNRLILIKRYQGIFAYIYAFLRQVGTIGLLTLSLKPDPYKWLIWKAQIRGTIDSLFAK